MRRQRRLGAVHLAADIARGEAAVEGAMVREGVHVVVHLAAVLAAENGPAAAHCRCDCRRHRRRRRRRHRQTTT